MNSTNRFFKFPLVVLMLGLMLSLSSCSGQDQPAKLVGSPLSVKQSPRDEEPELFRKTGLIETAEISESSGAIRSIHRQDAFWTINDSGHSAAVYCLSEKGELLATVILVGAKNRDWESMSRFTWADKHYLVVAETGDNLSQFNHYRLYIFQEPKFENTDPPLTLKVTPISIEFNYPDGARDCETIAVDPATNDIWMFEKVMQLNLRRQPHVYRLPAKNWLPRITRENSESATQNAGKKQSEAESPSRIVIQRQGELNHRFLVDGDFSPDGNQLILRTYTHIIHFQKNEKETWAEKLFKLQPTLLPLPIQNQGESIAFYNDSQFAFVTSEGVRQPVWSIDLAASLKEAKK